MCGGSAAFAAAAVSAAVFTDGLVDFSTGVVMQTASSSRTSIGVVSILIPVM